MVIKRCPFCRSDNVKVETLQEEVAAFTMLNFSGVVCQDCGGSGPKFASDVGDDEWLENEKRDSIVAWNKWTNSTDGEGGCDD